MKTPETQPARVLIGRNEQKISLKITRWQNAIDALNHLNQQWTLYFGVSITIAEISNLISSTVDQLIWTIRYKYVMSDIERKNYAEKHNVIIAKYVDMFNVPDYSAIKEAAHAAALDLKLITAKNEGEVIQMKLTITDQVWEWIPRLFNDENFSLTDELNTDIVESYSTYLSGLRGIFAVRFLEKFSVYLNFYNEIGGRLNIRTNIEGLQSCFENYSSGQLTQFRPSTSLIMEGNSFMIHLSNLSDDQVLEYAKQFNIQINDQS